MRKAPMPMASLLAVVSPGRDMDCTERDGEEGIDVTREADVPGGGEGHKEIGGRRCEAGWGDELRDMGLDVKRLRVRVKAGCLLLASRNVMFTCVSCAPTINGRRSTMSMPFTGCSSTARRRSPT